MHKTSPALGQTLLLSAACSRQNFRYSADTEPVEEVRATTRTKVRSLGRSAHPCENYEDLAATWPRSASVYAFASATCDQLTSKTSAWRL